MLMSLLAITFPSNVIRQLWPGSGRVLIDVLPPFTTGVAAWWPLSLWTDVSSIWADGGIL